MATFTAGSISDLSAVKDNIILSVRILRTWMQPSYKKQHVENMEMILMDLRYSTKDHFVSNFPFRKIDELLDVGQGMASIVVGSIIAILVEESCGTHTWCRIYRKQVIKDSEYVDLEEYAVTSGFAPSAKPLLHKTLTTISYVLNVVVDVGGV
ncbi:hypothetical protein Tco_0975703 [Tanacetum coccineum]|uniref:Uncharacterized protein n=1 Tax=Tanacetum coccineum TaxID=301880 RepID=A0ABQ5EF58_9ASTR